MNYEKWKKAFFSDKGKPMFETISCNCVGPQNGEPLCPCQMRNVKVRNGRFIFPERDLGPVRGAWGDE